jgi:hypothetical protein
MPHRSPPPSPSHARFFRFPVIRAHSCAMSASCHGPESLLNLHPLPTDAGEGGDSLRLSTWGVNRAFSYLVDHDVCPTCRARALDVTAPLHCTSYSARGPAALGPATSHIVLGGASDRRSASNRTLWWHLSACNNANTSPCHTRHCASNRTSVRVVANTRAHARARLLLQAYARSLGDADALAYATYGADGAIDASAHVPAPPPTV